MLPLIATVYSRPPRTFALPTTPGRRVEFRGGEAKVYTEPDMTVVLRRDDVVVVMDPRYMDWLPKYLRSCGEQHPPRATLELPAGYSIDADYNLLHSPVAGAGVEAGAEEEAVASSAPRRSRRKVDEPPIDPLASLPTWDPPAGE